MAPEEGLELLGEQPAVDLLGHVSRQEVHPGAPVVEVLQKKGLYSHFVIKHVDFRVPPLIQIFLHKIKPLSNFMANFENSLSPCQLMSKIHDDIERHS